MSKEYILKSIDEPRNYFVEEKEQNTLTSNKWFCNSELY